MEVFAEYENVAAGSYTAANEFLSESNAWKKLRERDEFGFTGKKRIH